MIGLCVNRKIVANFFHNVFASSSATGSANAEVSCAADAPMLNATIKSQINETTSLARNIQVDEDKEEPLE